MSDRLTYLLAAAVAAGALVPTPGPWPLAAAAVAVAVALRRPLLVVLFAAVLASLLAARAEAAYSPVGHRIDIDGPVELVTDPEPFGSGVRFDAVHAGRRLEAWAWGPQAARLRDRLAGEVVVVRGTADPLRGDAPWQRRRGVEGRLAVHAVGEWSPGPLHYRVANALRRTLEGGAGSMSPQRQALFAGFVYGDDRGQSALTADDFLAGGLTHLLAVSGQNVAFVLALAAPAVNVLGPRRRVFGIAVVLLVFATATRFEPSVLRATAMASVAAGGACLGREASGRRVLALAVAALLLVDPKLVHSLAFQLSVLASGGILFLGGRLASLIPGPRTLATAIAVTVAAQLGTAPLLVATFGGLPVASLPANLLAGPVSGPIMVWGLTAGFVAGVVGGGLAELIHLPTSLMITWVQGVARGAALAPLGQLRPGHLVALAIVAALGWATRSNGSRRILVAAAVIVMLAPSLAFARPPPVFTDLGPDSQLWQAGGAAVLVVGPETRADDLARGLRLGAVNRLDVVVLAHPGRAVAEQLEVIAGRARVVRIYGEPGARRPDAGMRLRVGDLVVEFTDHQGRLGAQVSEWAG